MSFLCHALSFHHLSVVPLPLGGRQVSPANTEKQISWSEWRGAGSARTQNRLLCCKTHTPMGGQCPLPISLFVRQDIHPDDFVCTNKSITCHPERRAIARSRSFAERGTSGAHPTRNTIGVSRQGSRLKSCYLIEVNVTFDMASQQNSLRDPAHDFVISRFAPFAPLTYAKFDSAQDDI